MVSREPAPHSWKVVRRCTESALKARRPVYQPWIPAVLENHDRSRRRWEIFVKQQQLRDGSCGSGACHQVVRCIARSCLPADQVTTAAGSWCRASHPDEGPRFVSWHSRSGNRRCRRTVLGDRDAWGVQGGRTVVTPHSVPVQISIEVAASTCSVLVRRCACDPTSQEAWTVCWLGGRQLGEARRMAERRELQRSPSQRNARGSPRRQRGRIRQLIDL